MPTYQTSKYAAAQALLRELLEEHDPNKTFSRHLSLNRRKRGRGLCRYPSPKNGNRGRIEISRYLLENELDDILNTIRHEVAHVIAGHAAGHGYAWKAAAKKVGARPERCGKEMVSEEAVARYVTNCAECGDLPGGRHRLTEATKRKIKRCRCGKCGSPLSDDRRSANR